MAPGECLFGGCLTGFVLWMDIIDTESTVLVEGLEKVMVVLCFVKMVAFLSSNAGGVV